MLHFLFTYLSYLQNSFLQICDFSEGGFLGYTFSDRKISLPIFGIGYFGVVDFGIDNFEASDFGGADFCAMESIKLWY